MTHRPAPPPTPSPVANDTILNVPRRRLPRFGTRTLLILMAIVAVYFGVQSHINRINEEAIERYYASSRRRILETDYEPMWEAVPALLLSERKGEYIFLADVVRRGLQGEERPQQYLKAIMVGTIRASSPNRRVIFEAYLDSDMPAEGRGAEYYFINRRGLRYCDLAMHHLAQDKPDLVFDIDWPQSKRDAAIAQYKKSR